MPVAIPKKSKKKKIIGIVILVFGLLLLGSASYIKIKLKNTLSFKSEPPFYEEQSLTKPISIRIKSIDIFLVVSEGAIDEKGIWQVSEDGVSHLNLSAYPGDKGNMVIYGHNKSQLLGPLKKIKVGDGIEIANEKGEKFYYKVEKTVIVKPEEIDYVLPKEKELLTIYTCTGWLDSKRFVVIASPNPSL